MSKPHMMSFRVSSKFRTVIGRLSRKLSSKDAKVSKTAVIELAVYNLARSRGVKMPGKGRKRV